MPLNLYLSDDPHILGKGGVSIINDDYNQDIYYPAGLLEHKGYVSFQYKLENVLNIKNNKEDKRSLGSTSWEVSGLVPLELPLTKKNAIAFSVRDFESNGELRNSDNGMSFHLSQDYRGNILAFSSEPFSFLRGGIGWEGYDNQNHNLFYEASLTPVDPVSISYRQFKREMFIETTLLEDAHVAGLNFTPSENVREISLRVSVPEIIHLNMAMENNQRQNAEFFLNTSLTPSLSVACNMRKRHLDYFNDIIIDNVASGHNGGIIDYSIIGIDMSYHPSATQYLVGIKQSSFEIDGGGVVTGDAIMDFWENLLAGERFLNYTLEIKTTQYHFGIENTVTNRLTLRGGFQYIISTPDGSLVHWTPFPLIKIGRLDEKVINLEYKRANLGVVTLGLTYKLGRLELSYGIGQIIPVKVKKEKERDGVVTETESAISKEGWDIGNIWQSIKENPGGNLQIMRVTWFF